MKHSPSRRPVKKSVVPTGLTLSRPASSDRLFARYAPEAQTGPLILPSCQLDCSRTSLRARRKLSERDRSLGRSSLDSTKVLEWLKAVHRIRTRCAPGRRALRFGCGPAGIRERERVAGASIRTIEHPTSNAQHRIVRCIGRSVFDAFPRTRSLIRQIRLSHRTVT